MSSLRIYATNYFHTTEQHQTSTDIKSIHVKRFQMKIQMRMTVDKFNHAVEGSERRC